METPISFSDFPNDILLNILSFLQPIHIPSFALTCRRISSLCNPSSPSLWLSLCDRRWGAKTNIPTWSAAPSHRLYKALDRFEPLIGFWRLVDNNTPSSTSLVFFEWLSSCITGFRVSPSPAAASYSVRKIPFLRLGLSAAGEAAGCLVPDGVPVTVGFSGCRRRMDLRLDDGGGLTSGVVMPERYQYFANREDGRRRRRMKKKERERVGRKRWEAGCFVAGYFVRISNCSPTPARPLQGLWKVILWFGVFSILFDELLV